MVVSTRIFFYFFLIENFQWFSNESNFLVIPSVVANVFFYSLIIVFQISLYFFPYNSKVYSFFQFLYSLQTNSIKIVFLQKVVFFKNICFSCESQSRRCWICRVHFRWDLRENWNLFSKWAQMKLRLFAMKQVKSFTIWRKNSDTRWICSQEGMLQHEREMSCSIDAIKTGAGCGSIWSLLSTRAQAPFAMDSRCWMMQFYRQYQGWMRMDRLQLIENLGKWAVQLMLHSVLLRIILLALIIINWWASFCFFSVIQPFWTCFKWKSMAKFEWDLQVFRQKASKRKKMTKNWIKERKNGKKVILNAFV